MSRFLWFTVYIADIHAKLKVYVNILEN